MTNPKITKSLAKLHANIKDAQCAIEELKSAGLEVLSVNIEPLFGRAQAQMYGVASFAQIFPDYQLVDFKHRPELMLVTVIDGVEYVCVTDATETTVGLA